MTTPKRSHYGTPGSHAFKASPLGRAKIAGVILPALDRLSREPIHIGIFESEAEYTGVRVHYADAPIGSDPMSQMLRMK